MNLTDDEVEANHLADTTDYGMWTSNLLGCSSDTTLEYIKQHIESLCARLSSNGKQRMLDRMMMRLPGRTVNTSGSALVAERVDWFVRHVTGRTAQYVLNLFFGSFSRVGLYYLEGLLVMIHRLVPGLAYRCLTGWTYDVPLPNLTVDGCMSHHNIVYGRYNISKHAPINAWKPVWDAAVSSGYAQYTTQLALLLLAETPLAEVLVHCTLSYIV
jgi:hypothetical protein